MSKFKNIAYFTICAKFDNFENIEYYYINVMKYEFYSSVKRTNHFITIQHALRYIKRFINLLFKTYNSNIIYVDIYNNRFKHKYKYCLSKL